MTSAGAYEEGLPVGDAHVFWTGRADEGRAVASDEEVGDAAEEEEKSNCAEDLEEGEAQCVLFFSELRCDGFLNDWVISGSWIRARHLSSLTEFSHGCVKCRTR